MSITESVKTCFGKYITFKGRATRSEYWWFTIFATALIVLLPLLVLAVFNFVAMLFAYVAAVFAVSLPMWSVTVRRLHDTNHSGWWMLCPVYPTILMFVKGSEGENNYGAGESQLQLPCPICSELVDANVSVCPYCGEATHFDVAEPASGIDKKVAIGVLALCGLLLVGGIALSFSGDSIETEPYGGYDLSEEDEELFGIEAEIVEDIDYQDASAIEEELDRLETWLGELGQEVYEELRDEGDVSIYTCQEVMNCDGAITTLGDKANQMTPTQQQRFWELKEAVDRMTSALDLYE